jgi:hypothetical protein
LASASELSRVVPAWAELAGQSLDPNPFYEPWMLLPALKILNDVDGFRAVLVWSQGQAESAEQRQLVGLFPYMIGHQHKRLPVSVSNILSHMYCFSCTPLLHKEHAREALQSYFSWLNSPHAPVKLVYFEKLPAEGAVHRLLVDVIQSRSLSVRVERRYLRAIYRRTSRALDAPEWPAPARLQKRLGRQKELLQEMGTLEFRRLEPRDDAEQWAQDFMDLEASGWKGREDTALACSEVHAEYFREITRASHALGRLRMSGLWLNGRAIAARVGFRAGEGSFLFKIAYDERYEKYSPGNLLELEHLAHGMHEGERWEDSGAAEGDHTALRLSLNTLLMEDLAISPGSIYADFILAVLPLLAFAKAHLARFLVRMKQWVRMARPSWRVRPGELGDPISAQALDRERL